MGEAAKITITNWYPYLLPLLPLVPRSLIVLRFRNFMSEQLSTAERAASEHRTVILALAGFSFSAGLALPAYGATTHADVLLPTFYVVVSFLCYLAALQVQSHKVVRWLDQVGSVLVDVATLCLILAVLCMVALIEPPPRYFLVIGTLAIAAWLADTILRFSSWWSFFGAKEGTK
jgi:hypothetical protein